MAAGAPANSQIPWILVVLDFRARKSTVRNYQSRGEQRRLLVLVMLAGLVVLLALKAADPNNWKWFERLAEPRNARVAAPVDTRLPVGARRDDAVQIAAAGPEAEAPPAQVVPGVDPQWFADLRDDAPFRPAETAALFQVFGALRQAGAAAIREASVGKLEYIQLFKQPGAYRGRLVTFRGRVEGAFKRTAPANEQGITEYFEVWTEHEDHRGLVAAYCLELPAEFPLGDRLKQPIELTGFYFKRLAYQDRARELSTVPLLVAQSFTWLPPPKVEPPADDWQQFVVAALVAAVLAAACVWYLARRRASPPDRLPPEKQGDQRLSFNRLKNLELAPDVGESLRRLSSDKPPEPEN